MRSVNSLIVVAHKNLLEQWQQSGLIRSESFASAALFAALAAAAAPAQRVGI
jgi:hypothetical protein